MEMDQSIEHKCIIKTKNLTKEYTRYEKEEGLKGSVISLFRRDRIIKSAVRNFDLEINEGEFIGLIGPNGAGKTTLMKMHIERKSSIWYNG